MRKLVVAALALAVLVPATALAGGWATVKLSSTANTPRDIQFGLRLSF